MLFAVDAKPYWSAWCILWCALLDKTDRTAARLARFNTSEISSGHRYFNGFPSTLCGAMAASALLTAIKYGVASGLAQALPIALGLMALGMVSNLPVPELLPRTNRVFNSFQLANAIAIYLCGFTMMFPG